MKAISPSVRSDWSKVAFVLFLWAALIQSGLAVETKPFLSGLFTDNMVLQREAAMPVWGWTEPGQAVTVKVNGRSAKAVADKDGKWMAKLPKMKAGGPFNLTVQGAQTITLTNVVLGDVWICSGQSNMEMGVGNVNDAAGEIARANYPEIRLYTVPRRVAYQPKENVESRWLVCNPTNITQGVWGGFSAAAYFFGREIHRDMHVPVGLIHTSWGGTVAEAWTSKEGLEKMKDFRPVLEQFAQLASEIEAGTYDYNDAMQRWYADNDPGTDAGMDKPGRTVSYWKTMELPQAWESGGLTNFDGVVWFQREFVLPDSWTGKDVILHLGPIDDQDTTWVNSTRVGGRNVYLESRDYKVSKAVLKPGRNMITVRVLDTGGLGGLDGKPGDLSVELAGDAGAPRLSLAGTWRYKETLELAKARPIPQPLNDNPNVTTVLYNGMIAPLVPFAVKGAIWYQGESNVGRAEQYQRLLPAMIDDWRRRFEAGDFPFLIVQLANFMAAKPEPTESGWAELREAQSRVAQTTSKTGLAVAIDIGDAADIHPKDKQDVGIRLAKAAEAIGYRRKVAFSGPVFKSMTVTGKKARLAFDHSENGLVVKGGKLEGFAIAGADGKFVWADAAIDGKSVIVSSSQIEKPVAVRYGWADNPVCNLYNGAGLPAVPFRTDADKKK